MKNIKAFTNKSLGINAFEYTYKKKDASQYLGKFD